jgi:hypothetical protein
VVLGAMPDSRARRLATCPTSNFFFFRFFIGAINRVRMQKKSQARIASLAQVSNAKQRVLAQMNA